MDKNAFLLILISVFLHAGWNFISRASRPSIAFFWFVEAFGGLFLLPILYFADISWGELPMEFWIYFSLSAVFESMYSIGLSKTYKKTDISIGYPLIRALPVLLVALITGCLGIGKPLSTPAKIGMVIVTCGCFVLPQKSFRDFNWRDFAKSIFGPVFLAAAGTTVYTISDSEALRYMKECSVSNSFAVSCMYFLLVKCGICSCLAPCVLFCREEREDLFKKCWRSINPYLVGIFTGAAYLLVLWAMTMVQNVSYLQAFRQLSLPLGVALGIIFLHEKFTYPKVVGVLMIVLGLILTVV